MGEGEKTLFEKLEEKDFSVKTLSEFIQFMKENHFKDLAEKVDAVIGYANSDPEEKRQNYLGYHIPRLIEIMKKQSPEIFEEKEKNDPLEEVRKLIPHFKTFLTWQSKEYMFESKLKNYGTDKYPVLGSFLFSKLNALAKSLGITSLEVLKKLFEGDNDEAIQKAFRLIIDPAKKEEKVTRIDPSLIGDNGTVGYTFDNGRLDDKLIRPSTESRSDKWV